jgi:Uma2 family endonuclease
MGNRERRDLRDGAERLDHARAKGEPVIALRDAIRRAGLSCEAVTDSLAVRIAPRAAYQPDAMVYCGPPPPLETREIAAPVILVEVLSAATELRDVHRKLIGYFRCRASRII